MPAQSVHWPTVDNYFPLDQQREQPEIYSDKKMGDRYTIVALINGMAQQFQVDSGAFLSTISKKLAMDLGLKLYRVPRIAARAATGHLSINESTTISLDFGIVKANVSFAVVSHPNYDPNLILLGSNALKDLSVVADFDFPEGDKP